MKSPHKRGFTMMEIVVSMSICCMILADVALIILFTGQNLRKMTNESEATKDVSFAMEFLRYTLSMADYTSVSISNANHRIEFDDPNLGGTASAFEFKGGHLWYDRDTSDGQEEEKGGRLINMTFEPVSARNIIHVDILSRGRSGEIVGNLIQASADIYLRNK